MIPRKILKKIRQIELRTNRVVGEGSSQPPPQAVGIARAVKDGNYTDELRFNVEIHAVFIEDSNASFSNRPPTNRKRSGFRRIR